MMQIPLQPGDDSERIPESVEFLVMQEPDGGFVAWATCAPIFTQAGTWDELREMAREAVLCHYGPDARVSRGPESAKADFAKFQRRIHSLLDADGTGSDSPRHRRHCDDAHPVIHLRMDPPAADG